MFLLVALALCKNLSNLSCLKEHMFIISMFPWFNKSVMLSWVLHSSSHKAAVKMLDRSLLIGGSNGEECTSKLNQVVDRIHFLTSV